MTTIPTPLPQATAEVLLYQTVDGTTRVDVRMVRDAVGPQKAMAPRFRTMSERIRNIFDEMKFREHSVIRKFRITDLTAREQIERVLATQAEQVIVDSQRRNETFFDAQSDKLDRRADDLRENLERELKNIEGEIREGKKAKRLAADLQSKIEAQKRVNEREQQRNHEKRSLFDAQDEIEQRNDSLIADVETRLQQWTGR